MRDRTRVMANAGFVQRVFTYLVNALEGVDERPALTKDPFHLIVRAMEEAEKFRELTGTEKYEVVRDALTRLLERQAVLLPSTLHEFLQFLLQHRLLASFATTIVEATKGNLGVNALS